MITNENYKAMHTARPIVLVCALLFFLLPLFNIKCSSPMGGDVKIASLKGHTLITGGKITANKDFEQKMKKTGENIFGEDTKEDKADKKESTSSKKEEKDVKMNIFALLSLILIVTALALAFIKIHNNNFYSLLAGGLSLVCLIILALSIKSFLGLKSSKSDSFNFDMGMLKVVPAIGFYLIALFVIAASIMSYLFIQKEKNVLHTNNIKKELDSSVQSNLENNIDKTIE